MADAGFRPRRGPGPACPCSLRTGVRDPRLRPEIESLPEPVSLPDVDTPIGIEFQDVSFAYGNGEPVLDRVNFRVDPGETVAVVGATGSGKSTLLSLIPRFYDPTEGSVLVGGADARELDLAELRRSVGIVPQETFLFSEKVRDNIAFGNEGATDEEVVRAAEIAGVHGQISAFPRRLRHDGRRVGASRSPAARSSGSPSPEPSSKTRRYYFWTMLRAASTPRRKSRSRKPSGRR